MIVMEPVFSQDCREPLEYQKAIRAADSCVAVGNYSMAQKLLNAAKVYCKDKANIVEAKKDSLFILIDQLRDKADNAFKEQQKAQAEQQKALTEIAHRIIRDAEHSIKNLDYVQGLSMLQDAVKLNAAHKDVSEALLEFVYFFAETGRYDRAQGVLDTVVVVLEQGSAAGNSPSNLSTFKNLTNLSQFHNAINTLSPGRLAQLEERYYPVMIPIPGGTDSLGDDNEYIVTLSPFQMAKTETTWWQYNLFCEVTGKGKPSNNGWGDIGDNPVCNVSWYDVVEYSNWISKQQGFLPTYEISKELHDSLNENEYDDLKWTVKLKEKSKSYRLPTEAEWEYAARAGSNSRFGNGKDILDPKEINVNVSSDNKTDYSIVGVNRGRTIAVASLDSPNAFGLYDMSGNVWEWCWDWFEDYSPYSQTNPKGPGSGSNRVDRGGSWRSNPGYCRVSVRGISMPDRGGLDLGFRLVRTE